MKIFISYSRDDAGNFAQHVHKYLMGFDNDVFIDVNSIRVGDPWENSIEENISNCDIFVVILTPDSLRSFNVEREILQAQKRNKIIVPCIHEYVEYKEIKWNLEKIQGIEFSDRYELAIRLYSKIKNYQNKIPVATNEKTILINDSQQDSQIQDNISNQSAQWHLDKAKEFEDVGQYDRALKQYDKAIEKEPYNFLARYNKALFLEKIEKFNEALEAIEQAIDLEPKNAEVWHSKASILEKLKKYEEALKALEIDLKLDSKDVKSWISKANILEKLKKFEESIQCYDNALTIEPKNTDIQRKKNLVLDQINKKINEQKNKNQSYNLSKQGDTFFEQKKYSEAIECYDMALKLYPNNQLASYNTNNIFSALSNRFLTIYLINKEKETNPSQGKITNYTDFLIGKGLFLRDQGKYQEAIEWYDKALEVEPNHAYALFYKGLSLFNLNRYDEAINCFDKALEIQPNYVDVLSHKGGILLGQGKNQEAIECFDQALAIAPNYQSSFIYKGNALYNQGKYQEALECFDMALKYSNNKYDPYDKNSAPTGRFLTIYLINKEKETNPSQGKITNYTDFLIGKGLFLRDQGKYQEAIEWYDKALEVEPNHAYALFYKGNDLYTQGKYQEAIEWYDKVLEVEPNHDNTLNLKGVALYNQGKYQEAIECFDKALEIKPNDVVLLYNKGNALYNQGKYQEAIEWYDKALEVEPNYKSAQDEKKKALKDLSKQKTLPKKKRFFGLLR